MSSEFALSPPRKRPMELLRLVGWAVALAFLVWAWRGAEMRPMTLITESGNILTLIKDFFPPDFTDWRLYATEMVVTLQVAIWGTLLAVVCAVPLGILSSDNIVPWWVYHPVRRLMDAARAINEMVFAMLFVVAVGLGPFAGVLALWVHTTGVLAKLFSEAVEAIEPSPVEGVRSTGEVASRFLPFAIPSLSLAYLGKEEKGFYALVPSTKCSLLSFLERACVMDLDVFRAPLKTEDVARRGHLSLEERSNLYMWGYHRVLDSFQFHITLTDGIADAGLRALVGAGLRKALEGVLDAPLRIDALTLFKQENRNRPFSAVARLPFANVQTAQETA